MRGLLSAAFITGLSAEKAGDYGAISTWLSCRDPLGSCSRIARGMRGSTVEMNLGRFGADSVEEVRSEGGEEEKLSRWTLR